MRWNADGTVTDLGLLVSAAYGLPIESRGLAISDGITVGYALVRANTQMALRWNADGTVINLSQQLKANGYGSNVSSAANGISNGVTVGCAKGQSTNNVYNAVRWNTDGTITSLHNQIAASGIDLGSNSYSLANATANGLTVGSVIGIASGHALLWKADGSVVDLQSFAANNVLASGATAIDESTGIIVGAANVNGNYPSVFWTPLNAGSDGANNLTIQNGYLTTIKRNFSQSAGQTVVNGGLVFDDGNAGNGLETFTLAGGTLSGAGSITGNLTQTGGVIAPGNSPGTLTINGDYLMSAGTYSIDIASLSSFDVLNVTGSATFTGGSFLINALSGYTPTIGDFFNVVTTGNGIFGADAVTTPEGWKFSQNGNMGQLSYIGQAVVPEPGTILLVLPALSLLGVGMIRRKNRVS